MGNFNEGQHPRVPAGSTKGGEFTSSGGGPGSKYLQEHGGMSEDQVRAASAIRNKEVFEKAGIPARITPEDQKIYDKIGTPEGDAEAKAWADKKDALHAEKEARKAAAASEPSHDYRGQYRSDAAAADSVAIYQESTQDIHDYLRRPNSGSYEKGAFKSTIEHLDKVVKQNDIEAPVLYRVMDAEFGKKFKVGAVVRDKAFLSTTKSNGALVHIEEDLSLSTETVKMTIKVPRGTKGLDMNAFLKGVKRSNEYPWQHEVVLPRGTKMKVLSNSGGNIEVEIVR